MEEYKDLLRRVLEDGQRVRDRTGVGTRSVFGAQARYSLRESFPLVTIKRTPFRAVLRELLWFLRGGTNIAYLREGGVTIWDEWADENGDLGPIYGAQWRSWRSPDGGEIDQIGRVVASLRSDPYSRRHIVSAWNPAELDRMALPPCHALFQFYVEEDGRLSCQLYQRSGDLFLGVPFNIASYAALTCMVAQVCGFAPGNFIHTFGDLHLYENHIEQAEHALAREPRPAPRLELNPGVCELDGFGPEDVRVVGYEPHPAIRAEVAV